MSAENEKRTKQIKCHCHECGEPIRRGEDFTTREVYDSPFDEQSKTIHLHVDNQLREDYGISCEQALYDEHWADFRYFDCPMCQRTIIRQCPSNGWHSYVRDYEDDQICLSCFEQIQLKAGASKESFEDGRIEGMFFNSNDLTTHGFEPVPGFHGYYIRTNEDVQNYCGTALRLIGKGCVIANEHERMAIGGLEGYVTMWAKSGKGEGNEIRIQA
jgi:predicted RNA-binding Zn-ribbon protein involved in translation (DUF1610 family)